MSRMPRLHWKLLTRKWSSSTQGLPAGKEDSPRHIKETRAYIRDFNASAATTSTALELYEKMLTLYPSRVNPGSLWATAKTVKPSA